ncbi:hypothetical protein [Pseudomonas protegens]
MDEKINKIWHGVLPFSVRPSVPEPLETAALARVLEDSPRGIEFGVNPRSDTPLKVGAPIPGYDAPALPLKPQRDPSLSLIALSGIDPTGEVMVEVPLVQNNTTFMPDKVLAGRRIGFAEHFVQGNRKLPIEYSRAFLGALGILRRAGAQLVPVPAQRVDETVQFNLRTRNEIDEHMSGYRLDALVSDSRTAAFHAACWSGYPVLSEPLEDGATLLFYGARWSKDSLTTLVREYRNARNGK